MTVEEPQWVPSRCETDPSEECQWDPQCPWYSTDCRHDKRREAARKKGERR